MIVLSVVGLVLDLAGVLALGWDLKRVQVKLRDDADQRLSVLDEVTEAVGGVEGFLKTVSGDFRDYYMDEGRASPVDATFDHRAAQDSLDEIKGSINGLADQLGMIARMMVAGVKNDRDTAGLSLRWTYGGLGAIVVGFSLQTIAYFT